MRDRRGAHRVLVGKPTGRNSLEDPVVDRSVILKLVSKKWDRDMGWIDLVKYMDRRWAFVNVVMNLRVPYNTGNFLSS
jgi:hypothetical protein